MEAIIVYSVVANMVILNTHKDLETHNYPSINLIITQLVSH